MHSAVIYSCTSKENIWQKKESVDPRRALIEVTNGQFNAHMSDIEATNQQREAKERHNDEMKQALRRINAEIQADPNLQTALRRVLGNHPDTVGLFRPEKETHILVADYVFTYYAYLTADGIKLFEPKSRDMQLFDPTVRKELHPIHESNWTPYMIEHLFPQEKFKDYDALKGKVDTIIGNLAKRPQ